MEVGCRNKRITNLSMGCVSLNKLFFYSGFFFWIVQEYIMRTKYFGIIGNGPAKILRIAALLLLISKIVFLNTNYSVRLFEFLLICGSVALISQLSSNAESRNTMLNVFIICMAARDIDFTELCNFSFWVSGFAWIFTVLSPYLGIFENDFIRETFRTRYYIGFDYVSFPSIYLFNIICSGFYAYTKKKNKSVPWIGILIAGLINLWVYKKTVTRLTFLVIMFFLIFYMLVEKLKVNILKKNKITILMASIIFPVAGVLSYVVSNMYNETDTRWLALNKLFNNRLLMNKRGMDRYKVTLFGQTIISNTDPQSSEYFFIDNGYISLLLRNGIVLFVLVLLIYTLLMQNSIRTNNTVLAIWVICVCGYCLVNGILLTPVTNCSLLAVWQIREDVMKIKTKFVKRIRFGDHGTKLI